MSLRYDVRIRAAAGNRRGKYTPWFSAIARPLTAAAPTNVTTRAIGNDSIELTWTPSSGNYSDTVELYELTYRDTTAPCTFLLQAGFEGISAKLIGLEFGHEYSLSIDAYNAAGAGYPQTLRSVVVGYGTPKTPMNVTVQAVDDTTANVQWDAVDGAAGYLLWKRNITKRNKTMELVNAEIDNKCADV